MSLMQNVLRHREELEQENAILREANQRLCEGAEAENQRALKAEVTRDAYREALEKAMDYLANGNHIVQAMFVMREALQRAGGGE